VFDEYTALMHWALGYIGSILEYWGTSYILWTYSYVGTIPKFDELVPPMLPVARPVLIHGQYAEGRSATAPNPVQRGIAVQAIEDG